MHQKPSPTSDNGGRNRMLGGREKKGSREREEENFEMKAEEGRRKVYAFF